MAKKRKDRLVYALFCVILAMFVILFFFFFRSGDTETTEHTEVIPAEVTTVTVRSNFADIRILPTEADKPQITYGTRDSEKNADEVILSQSGSEYLIEVERKSSNALSGLWRKSAPITLYLPQESLLKCNLNLSAGSVEVNDAKLQNLSVHGTAVRVKLDHAKLDRVNIVSKLGQFSGSGSTIASTNIKIDVADILLAGQSDVQGFALDATVSLGYIGSEEALGIEHPKFAVKYKDKITYQSAEAKIALDTNVARIRIKG